MSQRKPYSDDDAIEPWEIESENFVDDPDAPERPVSKVKKVEQRLGFCSGMPLYLSVFTFIFALLAFVAFDQGIVVVPDATTAAETVAAPVVAVETAVIDTEMTWWDKRESEFMELAAKKKTAWDIAMAEADEQLAKASHYSEAECLNYNPEWTQKLVKDAQANPWTGTSNTAQKKSSDAALLPMPVINLGMPKCGTTSEWAFFKCAGYHATHSNQGSECAGLCMRDAANIGFPVISECLKGNDAMLEINCQGAFGEEYKEGQYYSPKSKDDCFYPQLSLLEEMHMDDPNVTFLLAFRPIDDWIDSVVNWLGKKITEVSNCNLPNQPRGTPNPHDPDDIHDSSVHYICSHVIHARNFVRDHPSHALVELDLYDNDANAEILGALFPKNR